MYVIKKKNCTLLTQFQLLKYIIKYLNIILILNIICYIFKSNILFFK